MKTIEITKMSSGLNFAKDKTKKTKLEKSENNDCVVRAFSYAFNISYDRAHKFIETKMGRKHGKGTRGTVIHMRNLKASFGKTITEVGTKIVNGKPITYFERKRKKARKRLRQYTTESFIKNWPEGTYFILVRKHAFCIKDGVIYGNTDDSIKKLKRIKQAFLITQTPKNKK